jgi:hypothetical protein
MSVCSGEDSHDLQGEVRAVGALVDCAAQYQLVVLALDALKGVVHGEERRTHEVNEGHSRPWGLHDDDFPRAHPGRGEYPLDVRDDLQQQVVGVIVAVAEGDRPRYAAGIAADEGALRLHFGNHGAVTRSAIRNAVFHGASH